MTQQDSHKLDYRGDHPRFEGRRRGLRRTFEWWYELPLWVATLLGWAVIALFVLGLLTAALTFGTSPVVGFPSLVIATLVIAMFAQSARSIRQRRATLVLTYLRQAVRLNLPLPSVIAAASLSETGALAVDLRCLQYELEVGNSLGAALTTAAPQLSARDLALIDFADRNGMLPLVLDRLLTARLRRARNPRDRIAFVQSYPMAALTLVVGCVTLFDIYVMPKYVQIFHDFHVPIPAITMAMAQLSDLSLPIFVLLVLVWAVVSGVHLQSVFRLPRPLAYVAAPKAVITWFIPLLSAVERSRNYADLCTALADSIAGGHTLDSALAEALQLHLNPVLQRRVDEWRSRLAAGESLPDAARASWMPSLIVELLNPGNTGPDLAAVFSFAARFYGDRYRDRREILIGMTVPMVTLLIGLLVTGVALSIWLPLTRLITSTDPYTMRF